jgi:hypothetical protein
MAIHVEKIELGLADEMSCIFSNVEADFGDFSI